jgi:hypothetical protein
MVAADLRASQEPLGFEWFAGIPVIVAVDDGGPIGVTDWTFHAAQGTDRKWQKMWRTIWTGLFIAIVVLGGIGVILAARTRAARAASDGRTDTALLDLIRPQAYTIASAAVAHVPGNLTAAKNALEALLAGAAPDEALAAAYAHVAESERPYKRFEVSKAFRLGLDAALAGDRPSPS